MSTLHLLALSVIIIISSRAPIVIQTFSLIHLNFSEVACCNYDYEHEEDKNDHHVEAKLA